MPMCAFKQSEKGMKSIMNDEKKVKYNNLKEMLKVSGEKYGDRPAFYLEGTDLENSKIITQRDWVKEILIKNRKKLVKVLISNKKRN